MKVSDVPDKAWEVTPTPIPMKQVPDWDAMYALMKRKGFVVIESGDLRITKRNVLENITVKAFNSHMRSVRKLPLRTKHLGNNRWFCCL